MQVNSIQNISFCARKTKAEKQESRNKYFTYVSQFHVNDALKISVGREVQDGKHKLASAATLFTGFIGACTSMIASSNIAAKARELKISGNVTPQTLNKLAKQSKVAQVAALASSLLVISSVLIKDANNAKANKTANERGFLSDADYRQIKDKQTAYEITNFINKAHIV